MRPWFYLCKCIILTKAYGGDVIYPCEPSNIVLVIVFNLTYYLYFVAFFPCVTVFGYIYFGNGLISYETYARIHKIKCQNMTYLTLHANHLLYLFWKQLLRTPFILQDLDGICHENNWVLPTYHISQPNGKTV